MFENNTGNTHDKYLSNILLLQRGTDYILLAYYTYTVNSMRKLYIFIFPKRLFYAIILYTYINFELYEQIINRTYPIK